MSDMSEERGAEGDVNYGFGDVEELLVAAHPGNDRILPNRAP